MKKGSTTAYEFLADVIKELPIVFLLLFLLVGLYAIFVAEKLTPEGQDFKRIAKDLDDLVGMDYFGDFSIGVPVVTDMRVVMYPFSDPNLPADCKKQSCICMYYGKDELSCKTYPEVKSGCGKSCNSPCFAFSHTGYNRNVVNLKRGCHEISVS